MRIIRAGTNRIIKRKDVHCTVLYCIVFIRFGFRENDRFRIDIMQIGVTLKARNFLSSWRLTFPARTLFHDFYSCAVHLDTIESFIYPTDAQLDCSKNIKIYIKIYNSGAATCFGFSQPSSGSYCMCFAKVISINNQLKYVVYRISSV